MLRFMLRALYVDFNSYFASVEQQVRPELRGRPVAVVPMLADTTCAIAASVEAKRYGVKTGTPVAEARRLCPGIVFVVSTPRVYVEFHQRAKQIVESCAPIAAVNSIDEMWIRLGGRDQQREQAVALAREIKYRLRHELGEVLTCSIGIAPNMFLAKTASDMQKPDGLVVLELADLPQALHRLELSDFCGIGPRMLARLHEAGIFTTAQLTAADCDTLRKIWGGIEGERFWQQLHGLPYEPGATSTRSIGHSHVLAPERRTHAQAAAVLSKLTQKAAMRLRDAGYLTGQVTVQIKLRGGARYQAQRRLDPTDCTRHLLAVLDELLGELQRERSFRLGYPLAVGVAFTGLVPRAGQSRPLFAHAAHGEALDRAVDQLNLKYGNHTVVWGSALGVRKDARMAIAFNHIPDLRLEADPPERGKRKSP